MKPKESGKVWASKKREGQGQEKRRRAGQRGTGILELDDGAVRSLER